MANAHTDRRRRAAVAARPDPKADMVWIDGRTFAISDEAGEITAPTDGLVHDDRRHLSHLTVAVEQADIEVLA